MSRRLDCVSDWIELTVSRKVVLRFLPDVTVEVSHRRRPRPWRRCSDGGVRGRRPLCCRSLSNFSTFVSFCGQELGTLRRRRHSHSLLLFARTPSTDRWNRASLCDIYCHFGSTFNVRTGWDAQCAGRRLVPSTTLTRCCCFFVYDVHV